MRRQPERLHLLLSLQPRDPAHYRVGFISINIITAIIMHGRQDKHNHHHHHDHHHHYILWSYPNRHHNQHHHHQQTLSGAFVTIAIAIIINVTYYRVTSIHSFFDGSANKMKPLWMTCNHCFDAVHYIFQC